MLLRKMHKKFKQCKKSEKIKMLPEIHKVVSHLSDTKSGSGGYYLKKYWKNSIERA